MPESELQLRLQQISEPTKAHERTRRIAEMAWSYADQDDYQMQYVNDELAEASRAGNAFRQVYERISIFELYDRLVGKQRQSDLGPALRVMARCAHPSHVDLATFEFVDDAWTLRCGLHAKPWTKHELAAMIWGFQPNVDWFKVAERMTKEFAGVSFEQIRDQIPRRARHLAVAPAPNLEIQDDSYEREVELAVARQRVQAEARRRVRREDDIRIHTPLPLGATLAQLLAQPRREEPWTIDGLHGYGTNTVIIGGHKSGKTKLVLEVLRSLADGVPMFGDRKVRQISGNIAYVNLEVDDDEMRERLEQLDIQRPDRIFPLNLRSHRFDLLNEETFSQIVAFLNDHNIEVLIIDPWVRVNLSENENDNASAGRYLQAIDTLKAETGVKDVILAAHSAKGLEVGSDLTVRGAGAVDAWADYRWMAYADSDRRHYFKLGGSRKNDEQLSIMRESKIGPDGRLRLSLQTQVRAANNHLDAQILAYVGAHAGCVKGEIAAGIGGTKSIVLKAIDRLHTSFDIKIEVIGKAHHCYLPAAAPLGAI